MCIRDRILDGDVAIDDTRTQGSVYESLNPVEVYGNSTLITSGHVAMRTEYGTGGGESGICVKMTGEGSKAILGSDGSYWAAESAVYSSLANTEVIINDGTYERKNENHRAVDSQGRIEVNGGTIRNLWCKGNLYINGGTFDNGSVSVSYTHLDAMEDLKYVQPDIVIVDLLMPVMDGIKMCIRDSQWTSKSFNSGYVNTTDRSFYFFLYRNDRINLCVAH